MKSEKNINYNSDDETLKSKNIHSNKQINKNTNNHYINKENDFLNELDDVQKLKRLFLIYTGNEKKLHSQKFLKLLNDAALLDKEFDSKYADIVFFAASKSKTHIDFQGFCELILQISEIKFPLEFIKNQAFALNKILNEFLFPLLITIYSNSNLNYNRTGFSSSKGFQSHTDYTKLIIKVNSNIDMKEVLEKHLYLIIKIYQKYFPWESLNISHDKKVNLSEKSFGKFCKDFEIQPNLVSLIKLNDVYINSTLNTKLIISVFDSIFDKTVRNQGSYYTLFNFIACLYLISIQSILHFGHTLNSNKNTINNEQAYREDYNPYIKSHSFRNNNLRNEVDYKIDDFAEGEDISINYFKNFCHL